MQELADRGVAVINSAVFNAGFLVGGAYFDYRRVSREDEADRPLFAWRDKFHALCQRHDVAPAAACVAFGVAPPGVAAVALNTSNPKRIAEFDALAAAEAPDAFWLEAKDAGLIDSRFPLPAN
ncbi:MAG: aldo/keto reductase [Planctomycetota bacterium]